MKCRVAMVEDYEELCRWWIAHNWTPVALEVLPNGFVVEDDDGILMCAGFLYMTNNAPIGMMEWIVTNPKFSGKKLYRALQMLIEEILKLAKENKVLFVYSKISHSGLEKLYNKCGFISGDVAMKDMTCVIKENL